MPFVIAPLSDVKGINNYPEYIEALKALEAAAFIRADKQWSGVSVGGLLPQSGQFGIGPLRKNDMAADTSDNTPSGSYTFRKNFTATGWGDIFRYTVRNDYIQAFAGWLISDDVLRILQFRIEIGSNLFPIWDIQEAQRMNRFAIILKQDEGGELVADPKTRVLMRVYIESTGFQRVVPLGFSMFRRSDLILTET